MSRLADWQIKDACEEQHWPTVWHRRIVQGGSQPSLCRVTHKIEPIPNAGPLVDPFDEDLLGPASIDMRLGDVFSSPHAMDESWITRDGIRIAKAIPAFADGGWMIDGRMVKKMQGTGVEVTVRPGQNIACISAEYYRLPPNLYGELYTKSSRAREWINHSTASSIHPGFQGRIAFELQYSGEGPYVLRTGMRLVHIAFGLLDQPPAVPYFLQEKAKYKGQMDNVRSLDPAREA
jgi:deoxycytidine triphosphate deaminase